MSNPLFPNLRHHHRTVIDWRLTDGTPCPPLTLHHLTLGDPEAPAVLVLHGTGGSAEGLMTKHFGDVLFGPGGPFDARYHHVIVPDALGHGRSAKPSDGLRMRFPRYGYGDMVALQHRLVTEILPSRGTRPPRLKAVIGLSMGGMHAWLWATRYPDEMDHVIALASQPSAMSGRNWLMRRAMVDAVRADPAWRGGDYTEPPPALHHASLLFSIAMNGGLDGLQRLAPSRESADAWLDERRRHPIDVDANDFIRQWEASADYDPSRELDRIRARVLSIVSDDDERLLIPTLARLVSTIPGAVLHRVPASDRTAGHATVGDARRWIDVLRAFLDPAS